MLLNISSCVLVVICVSSLEKDLLSCVAHFKIVFLLLIELYSSLYVMGISLMSWVICKCLLPFCESSFTFLMMSFAAQKFYFFTCFLPFVCSFGLWRLCLTQGHKDLVLYNLVRVL